MNSFDFNKKLKVHFIGIGGISMSAIAFILLENGFIVQGSDISENDNVKKIKEKGIKVFIGHKSENITSDIDIVVYSKAIHDDNEEIKDLILNYYQGRKSLVRLCLIIKKGFVCQEHMEKPLQHL